MTSQTVCQILRNFYKKLTQLRARSEAGFTIIEVLVAMVSFGIILSITGLIIGAFITQESVTQNSANAQNSYQRSIDELRYLIAGATPCPQSSSSTTSAAYAQPIVAAPASLTGSNALVFSSYIPTVNSASGRITTNVAVVNVYAKNKVLYASLTPCPGFSFTNGSRLLVDANNFFAIGSSFYYVLAPSTPSSWPYPTSQTVTGSALADIIAIGLNLEFQSGNANPIPISTLVYLEAITCNQPPPPATVGQCE